MTLNSHATDDRVRAGQALADWLETGAFPDRSIAHAPGRHGLLLELTLGTTRRRGTLEWMIGRLARTPPPVRTQAWLMLGLYQLFFMDHIADYAAVHATVEAAKSDLSGNQIRFLNGCLRNALRQRTALSAEREQAPLAVRVSHPAFLIERWASRLDMAAIERICDWNNRAPETVVRVRTADPSAYAEQLKNEGFEVRPHPARPEDMLILPRGTPVTRLPGYDEGLLVAQDPATRIAVDLLDPRPGETILDACAAPGGKTIALADATNAQARIVAADKHADRMVRLEENLRRSRLEDAVRVLNVDWTLPQHPAGLPKTFDAILLDVPCSNTGVLRRRADARWTFAEERLRTLCRTQRALLDACSKRVRPGGRLVYSTCSMEPEENAGQVARWLEDHPDFRLETAFECLPGEAETDGAYAARLLRL